MTSSPEYVADVGGGEASPAVPALAEASPASPTPRRRRQRQLSLVEDTPRALVKWAGGKTKLLTHLLPRLPGDLAAGRYFEPFAGGAALLFAALPIRATISDTNGDLVELYQEVARDPVGVHAALTDLFREHAADREGTYYGYRAQWNDARRGWSARRRAAIMLYLNRTCFNGLWRVNRAGRMNVPLGRPSGRQPVSCPSMAHLSAVSTALRGCQILCSDYVDAVVLAGRGDFVYFDPPYLATSRTANFSSYTAGGFTVDDHDALGRQAVALVERGVRVMVSSADVPGARERYPGFAVHEVSASRSIAAAGGSRAQVGELILIGGYEPSPPRTSS